MEAAAQQEETQLRSRKTQDERKERMLKKNTEMKAKVNSVTCDNKKRSCRRSTATTTTTIRAARTTQVKETKRRRR